MTNEEQILNYLKNKHLKNKINYNDIIDNSVKFLNDNTEQPFINFIITARGRTNFAEPLYNSYLDAKDNFNEKIIFTIVEHDLGPRHMKFFKDKNVNYIFIESQPDELFNKCLSYNIGANVPIQPKYFLFHDLDILIQKDFFKNIAENLKNYKALQCYCNRRVLNCSPDLTGELISKRINVNNLKEGTLGVHLPMFNGQPSLGSKGGSILIEKDIFYKTGGYEDSLFKAYSAEDNFFWEKVSVFTEIAYADHPPIELFHMWHEPQYNKNPHLMEMEQDYNFFKALSIQHKEEFINFTSIFKSNHVEQ